MATMNRQLVTMNHELLSGRRYDFGLTQGELASRAGCSYRTVQRAEKGMRVRRRTAREIGQALGVDLTTIVASRTPHGDTMPEDDMSSREDRIVAAFRAADDAIQNNLAGEGGYGSNELTAVLALLAAKYKCAGAAQSRKLASGLLVVQVPVDPAKAIGSEVAVAK